ncbi:hypothetical protein ABW20_dc0103545 [Dactylellina cionopaga]|nr:hypothetical protein ABW20_dc0103545 [Dactylellina cionopaga]
MRIYSWLWHIQSLLSSPNPENPAAPEIATQLITNPDLFHQNAKLYTARYASPTEIPAKVKEIRQRQLEKVRKVSKKELDYITSLYGKPSSEKVKEVFESF